MSTCDTLLHTLLVHVILERDIRNDVTTLNVLMSLLAVHATHHRYQQVGSRLVCFTISSSAVRTGVWKGVEAPGTAEVSIST